LTQNGHRRRGRDWRQSTRPAWECSGTLSRRPRQMGGGEDPPSSSGSASRRPRRGEVRSIDDPRSQAYRRSLPRQPGLGRDAGSFASGMRLLGKFPRRQKSIAEPGSRGPSPRKSLNDGSRLLEEGRRARHRRRIRRRVVGIVLVVFGILVWVITATLPLTPYYARLVLLGQRELLSIGVIAGGAFVVAGIIRIGTSVRR
jgi:hypothetical protein